MLEEQEASNSDLQMRSGHPSAPGVHAAQQHLVLH